MSTGVNKAILVGHLGAAPEVRSFPDGGRICTFRMATNRAWRDKASGERREKAEWHGIVLRGDGLIDVAARYLSKGSKVYVEGELRTRKWQDRDGQDRYTTEIVVAGFGGRMVLLDPAPDRDGAAGDRSDTTPGDTRDTPPPAAGDFDDEIPF